MSNRTVWTSSRVFEPPFVTHRTTGLGRSPLYCRMGSMQPRAHKIDGVIPRSHATLASLPAFKDMERNLPAFELVLNNSEIVASMRQTEIALWDKLAARTKLVEAPTKFSPDGVHFYNVPDKDVGIGIQSGEAGYLNGLPTHSYPGYLDYDTTCWSPAGSHNPYFRILSNIPLKPWFEGLFTKKGCLSPTTLISNNTKVARGRHIDWAVSTMTALGASGGAAMRITAFPSSEIALPKLAIEYAAFGKIVMYVNFAPRTDLLMDEEYWERFYEADGTLGYSYNSLYHEVRADPTFQVYQSASPKMKLMTGQTGMLYLLDQTPESWEKLSGLVHRALDLWLDFYSADSSQARSAEESRRLAEYDQVLLAMPRRDPDNARVVALAGEEVVEQILQVACKEPSAF